MLVEEGARAVLTDIAALATAKAEKIAPEYPQDVVIGGDFLCLRWYAADEPWQF